MTPIVKPARRGPRSPKRIARTSVTKRGGRIRRRVTLGARRRGVKAAGGVDPDTWTAIRDFYLDRCAYGCGRLATQQDHVIPIAMGGLHVASNVVPACAKCNYAKGTRTWEPVMRHHFMEPQ